MLLSIHFPIADARPLLDHPVLPVPSWKAGPLLTEFVHFFGNVGQRDAPRLEALPGLAHAQRAADELFYANARRALSFPLLEKRELGPLRAPQGAFRRLYRDTTGVVARVEVALSVSPGAGKPLDGRSCLTVLRDFLGLPTDVALLPARGASGAASRVRQVVRAPLLQAGDVLARLFFRATTAVAGADVPDAPDAPGGAVVCGEPLVFVLHDGAELSELPPRAQPVDPTATHGARVAYLRFCRGDRRVGAWFLDEGSAGGYDRRRIRLGLARLHAERQALLNVLGACERNGRRTPAVDAFLEARLGLLTEAVKYGMDQRAVRGITSAYDSVLPEEAQRLLEDSVTAAVAARAESGREAERDRAAQRLPEVPSRVRGFAEERPGDGRAGVFVCYSSKDRAVREKLSEHLDLLGGPWPCWDDSKIAPGTEWLPEIRRGLERARVAVFLISAPFLASPFIREVELPALLARLPPRCLLPFWVSAVPKNARGLDLFTRLQGVKSVNAPDRPLLSAFPRERWDEVFAAFTDAVAEALRIELAAA